mmetsp:Transcript_46299/g.99136  ORF Transcript_46299/g.99136 Transcript_46299/m.99136 type:complete len:89 (-) Transcript_46299:374-640(-)
MVGFWLQAVRRVRESDTKVWLSTIACCRSVFHLSRALGCVLMVALGGVRESCGLYFRLVRPVWQDFGLQTSFVWCKKLARRNLTEGRW